MSKITVHLMRGSNRSGGTIMALELSGLEHTKKWWSMMDTKTPEFFAINPNGKVPVVDTEQGRFYESHAILRYIARESGKLYGSSSFEQAQIDQWLDWTNCELAPLLYGFVYTTFGFEFPGMNYQKDYMYKSKANFGKKMKIANEALNGRNWLVGDEVSIADIALFVYTHQWAFFAIGDKQRKGYPHYFAWLERFAELDAFKHLFGRLRLHPTGLPFYKIESGPQQKPKQQKKKKQKQQQPKKAAPKKPKGPVFPDTNFNLMAFKTYFINEADRAAAMAKFWEDFDSEGWAIYHLKYIRYKNETSKLFRTKNLMGGFLRSYEPYGKYIFGTHLVLGDEPEYTMQGVWLIRGKDLVKEFLEHDYYPTYEWNKLDHTNEEHRAIVNTFWNNMREEDEDKLSDGLTLRYFKWVK